jgi:hypothetical protein
VCADTQRERERERAPSFPHRPRRRMSEKNDLKQSKKKILFFCRSQELSGAGEDGSHRTPYTLSFAVLFLMFLLTVYFAKRYHPNLPCQEYVACK